MRKIFVLLIVICIFLQNVFSQAQISYKGSRNYTLVERTDLRRYDNGKYKGLVSREVRSFIIPQKSMDQKSFLYEGNFYVDEDTLRASRNVSVAVHQAVESVFRIDQNGNFTMLEDKGYPSFRSFPSFSSQKLNPGDTWQASAERAVDPLNKGISTKLPLFVEYKYIRDEEYNGDPVYLLTANWATRYGSTFKYVDLEGDSELKSATGKHSATIYVSKETGKAVVVRDSVDETFSYYDGNSYTFKGTISLFTEYPPTVNTDELIPKIASIKNVEVEKTSAGCTLRMVDLKFKPDSPQLLSGEELRLDQIAEILKKVPQSKFLIEGHTARTGVEEGEYELSLERANTIAAEMIKRGIGADRFICKGSGGKKPIDTNETTEGRARNRRVEITILE